MSQLDVQRQIQALEDKVERLRKADVSALYLPWTQRILNPFPLASSGATWGEQAQPWAATLLGWYCTVFVTTTNNGTNFWTIELVDSAGNVLGTMSTAAIAASTWTRLTAVTPSQPAASTNPRTSIRATATLSPGTLYILPALALLRTGN